MPATDPHPALPPRRLFLGLMPDAAARDALVEHQRHWFWDERSRPTRPARLHLTLHFLGDVDAMREHALREALRGERVAPFALRLRTPECWGRNGVAVLLPDESAPLRELRERLLRPLAEAGIAAARGAWTPHVTLARDAHASAPPEAAPPVAWTVRGFALVHSRLAPPVRYEVVESWGGG
jgi:2'-5' RNA ligase